MIQSLRIRHFIIVYYALHMAYLTKIYVKRQIEAENITFRKKHANKVYVEVPILVLALGLHSFLQIHEF